MYQRDLAEVKDFIRLPAFVKKIVEEDYTYEKLAQLIPAEVMKNARRVILTGNGDSYCASLALRIFFEKMLHMSDVVAERCIDVGRHFYFNSDEDLSQTLVFVTSASGTGARVAEAMRRCSKKGCSTFSVTASADSLIAKDAKFVLVETGEKVYDYHYSTQSFTYVNAMVNLYLVALYGGVVRGVITPERERELRAELVRYAESFVPVLDDIDTQMYELALSWADTIGYDFVGTGVDIAAAYFGAAKFFEYAGSINMYSDSEDWNHINFFMRDRALLGTCVAASKGNESLSRTIETIGGMVKSDRRVLVVTECAPDQFPAGVTVCQLPDTTVLEFKPLMNFIPFTLLGFHIARMRDLGFFVSDGGYGTGPLFAEEDMNKIKTSEIVYID